jgi:hypothetical protein
VNDGALRIEDVYNFDAADAQHIGNQRPMATPPHRLSAHERRALTSREFKQLGQPSGKLRAADVISVAAKCRIAPSSVRGI